MLAIRRLSLLLAALLSLTWAETARAEKTAYELVSPTACIVGGGALSHGSNLEWRIQLGAFTHTDPRTLQRRVEARHLSADVFTALWAPLDEEQVMVSRRFTTRRSARRAVGRYKALGFKNAFVRLYRIYN